MLALALVQTTGGAAFAAEGRPNVILLMTDDQGHGDLSCHGNPVLKTPNLDKLHAESVRFTDYHVSPTCSPTRCALMTGHWTDRAGAWHTISGRSLLRENETTLGQIFAAGGYATGMFGKWHLGDNHPLRPEDRGFQEVMRHGGGGVGQTPDIWDNAYFDGAYFHNSKPEAVKGFCTDVWFDYARRFMESRAKAGKPFFAYIATNAPHGPYHAPVEFSEPYADLGPATASFFGMIANIDANVGKLRAWLAESGLAENTLFLYTTDNGTAGGGKVFNSGMRGTKGSEYEGGHRVPLFVHWPAGGLTGGRDIDTLTAHVDIAPTLIDLCGLPAPAGVKFDGRSLKPLLEGKTDDWPHDRALVTDSQRVLHPVKWKNSAVMSGALRLVNGKELYDIKADPGQKRDIAAENPAEAARLHAFYEAWWTELEPTFAEPVRVTVGNPAQELSVLTCHDWFTAGMTPWNHQAIRALKDKPDARGPWKIRVDSAGEYRIELRRWPAESGAAIDEALPPGEDVPGVVAYRAHPGIPYPAVKARLEVGGQSVETAVQPGAAAAAFTVKLEAGPADLSGTFFDADGGEQGAYYAYVRKL
ncbi:MAG: arylsulfatase [Verrucomicrobiae bacterium]|nr:arylsulfatase [Verrucomicrobiae bacterium]